MQQLFFIWLWVQSFGKNQRKKPRETEEEVREELIKSIVKNDHSNNVKLNKKVERVTKNKDAVSVVKEYERLIKMQKQNIVCLDCGQGYLFERFKESDKFINIV